VRQSPIPVRWGIVGTANIARAQFLPGLREAGGGRAAVVASRDRSRADAYAAANGIDRGVGNYAALVESPDVDAVYVALPNSLHAEWTTRALRAGKAVLCEKPLSVGSARTAEVLDVAATADKPLWEAFVFPFQAQHQRLLALLADGAIGHPAEIRSAFHFLLSATANIRLEATLGGGALADVGCYPIRLAYEIFCSAAGGAAAPDSAADPGDVRAEACTAVSEGEVDVDAAGIARFGPARRLIFSCGFRRPHDTFTSVVGTQGQLHLTNPFHPSRADSLIIARPGKEPVVEHPTADERAFTAAIRHIHAVLRGEAAPARTAGQFSLPASRTLEQLQSLARPAGDGR
jgi:predicted dehydrogenase